MFETHTQKYLQLKGAQANRSPTLQVCHTGRNAQNAQDMQRIIDSGLTVWQAAQYCSQGWDRWRAAAHEQSDPDSFQLPCRLSPRRCDICGLHKQSPVVPDKQKCLLNLRLWTQHPGKAGIVKVIVTPRKRSHLL